MPDIDVVNAQLLSLLQDDGRPFHVQQARQIRTYREAWAAAGHSHAPRVSVSRSIFPLMTDYDRQLFIRESQGRDQIGVMPPFPIGFIEESLAALDRAVTS